MTQLNRKLTEIEQSILAEAEKIAELKRREAEDTHRQAMDSVENEILGEMYERIQGEVGQIRAQTVKEVVQYEQKKKRELLASRKELQERVFQNVAQQLIAFAASADYAAYLKAAAARLAGEFDESGSELLVNPRDTELAKGLCMLFTHAPTVVPTEAIRLGGLRLRNASSGILVDETLDFKLEEQQQWFYSHSGLLLD